MLFLLLFGIVGLVWALCWMIALGGLLWAKWRRSPEHLNSAQKTFFRLTGVGVGAGLLLWFLLAPPVWFVYKQEFGEYPWFVAKELRGYSTGGYDSQEIRLRFKVAPSVISRLAKARHLVRVKSVDLGQTMEAPEWGNPGVTGKWWVYEEDGKGDKNFSREEVGLFYDPQREWAFYSYVGGD